MKNFPPEVSEILDNYVYRLIDPRNGETFYVGKGKESRVFQHINEELPEDGKEDGRQRKNRRIREIKNAGFEVQHVIHRHGMDSKTAFEVEGALMDAYPGILNVSGGHYNTDRGAAHAKEIIERYTAEEIELKHKVIEILVPRSASETNLYDATRFQWKVDVTRAGRAELALAVIKGRVVEVFQIEKWLEATSNNFPSLAEEGAPSGRFGFVGSIAPTTIRNLYLRRRMPERRRGAANPIRYFGI